MMTAVGVLTPLSFSPFSNFCEETRLLGVLKLLLRFSFGLFVNVGDGFGRRGCDAGRGWIIGRRSEAGVVRAKRAKRAYF
jgi:hypothetical protein